MVDKLVCPPAIKSPFSFHLGYGYPRHFLLARDTLHFALLHYKQCKQYHRIFSLYSFLVPTGPPQNFTVSQHTARNITLSWSPPAPTLRNGVITGYSLSCVPETGAHGRDTTNLQYTAADTFTLGGFTPATSYNCSISASNSQGSGPATYLVDTTLEARK